MTLSYIDIDECKIQASILLKLFRSNFTDQHPKAAQRFRILPELADFTIPQILSKEIKLKHALAVIARENGFSSWGELKAYCMREEANPFVGCLVGGFLNSWFATYEEAKAYQLSKGGFLLPYKHHYLVCEEPFVYQMGLEPNHKDWQLIGLDWVKPLNLQARHRLYQRWVKKRN